MSKVKNEAAKVHPTAFTALPKGVKQQATRMTKRKRGFLRSMTGAEETYQEWRRNSFKGAWWWQYFKEQNAA